MDEQRKNTLQNDEDEIDLLLLARTMWKSFLKLWWLVLILIAAGAAGALAVRTLWNEPMYRSSATFTVATGDGESASYSYYYDMNTADQLSLTFPYILDSSYFRSVLMDRLGADTLNGTITAETIENSNVVTMNVESSDAQDAYDILTAALDIYPETARFVLGDIRFSYLDEPELPQEPYNRFGALKTLAMGGALGAAASLLMLGIEALLRKTAHSPEEMKKITSLRCLAMVPQVQLKARKKRMSRNLLVTDRRIPYGYRESVRALQLRIEKAMQKNGAKVLLITGTAVGEGKSTLALNLAETFASRGKKVLFIDGDLRKQNDARMIGLRRGNGIAAVVKDNKDPKRLIRKWKGSGMWFLGGTKPEKQAAAVLSSPKVEKFLTGMRKQMDYIIIDTPPCGMFQDAGLLADLADAVLYVVKYDYAPQREIRAGFSTLQGRNASFLGYVFNCYPEAASEYGYGRYGYGGYGRYGYGRYGYGGYREGRAEND